MDCYPESLASIRILNRSAVRKHALSCASKFRANKFGRVSEEFFIEVEADVENFIRELRNKWPVSLDAPLPLPENTRCVTMALSDKVMAALNDAIARLIQGKVKKQPSVGVTLRATR